MDDLFQQPEQDRDFLTELVGEGKKFKDAQSLARGKAESDHFIETLKGQLDELRQDYLRLDAESKTRASLEELLNRKQEPDAITPTRTEITPPPPTKPDPRELETLIDSRLSQHEIKRREEANLNQTRELLSQRYGRDYQTKLKEQIDILGLDTDYVNSLARKSPDAVYRLLGLEQTAQPFASPPRTTSLNSLQRAPRERTRSYYLELKKTNPTEYLSPKTNVQMHQDAMRLGERFFDVDE